MSYVCDPRSLATLPGQEDLVGLTALLDPATLPGRVARINMLTKGSKSMFLAMSPQKTPTKLPAEFITTPVKTMVEGTVLVHATG